MEPASFNDRVKNILTTEVKFVIAVVFFVFGVAAPYYAMRQDIALIQASVSNINTNHEAHIQDLNQNLKDALEAIKQQQIQINAVQQSQAVQQQQISYLQKK